MGKEKVVIAIGSSLIGIIGSFGIKKLYDTYNYNEDGYNKYGFDKYGFNKERFDKKGFNKNGFNTKGFDRKGFDNEGYDTLGYDINGRDRNGFNHDGYNCDGFNIQGFNIKGYNSLGFNIEEIDCYGKTKIHYLNHINELNVFQVKAKKQMKENEFAYALHDIRIGIELGLRCLIDHYLGIYYSDYKLIDMIDTCFRNKLVDGDFKDKLHSARIHCNDTQHYNEEDEKNYDQVHFSYKVLEELIDLVKKFTLD